MEEILHLEPNTLRPHKVIEEMEKAGIFAFSSGELERLIESVRENGFLQPILVTRGENGEFLRVAGKMRVEAAKNLRCTVPAYLRQFPDDRSIIEAAKAENFRRRLWDAKRVLQEESVIEKFMSRLTRKRIENVKKLHPDLQKLCKNGMLRHRSDEGLIRDLKELSYETQQKIAGAFQELSSIQRTKVISNSEELEKARKEIEEAAKKCMEMEEQHKKETEHLRSQIKELNEAISAFSIEDSEVIESWKKQVKELKQALSQKENEVNRLRNEILEAHSLKKHEIEEIKNQKARLLLDTTDKLCNDVEGAFKVYITHLEHTIKNNEIGRDVLIVTGDKLKKMQKNINSYQEKIKRLLAHS